MRVLYLAAGILAISTASQAFADDAPPSPSPPDHAIELGAGIGRSDLRASLPDIPGHVGIDATGYKAFVGYRFSKYVSIEAAYIDGGTLTYKLDGARVDLHPKIEQLSVVGSYPIFNWLSVYARAGADHWKSDLTLTVGTLQGTLNGSDTDFAWGAGLQTFFDRALVRLEYEQMKTNQDVDGILPVDFRHQLISLSIVWLL